MTISSLTIGLSTHAPRSLVSPIRNMVRKPTSLRVTYVLLLICFLLLRWKAVSSQDFFDGGRQVLEWTASGTVRNDDERLLSTMSSVCRIIHQEGERRYCFGALVSSRWLLTAISCAPHDMSSANHHVRVICGYTSSSPACSEKEFDVVEIKTLKSATTGQKQEHNIALLKLDAYVPGPYIKFEENDGPDFYILQQKEVLDVFLKRSYMEEAQTLDAGQKANIDLIGLPLMMKPSSMRHRDRTENSVLQVTASCLATACQLFSDGVNKCTFNCITPLEHRFISSITRDCNEVQSASTMTPSFHRSPSASTDEEAFLDSSRPIPLAGRGLIPPFAPPLLCSSDTKAKLQSMSSEQMMSKLKPLVNNDHATTVKGFLICSEFKINTTDSNNNTLLHYAAYDDTSKTAKVLCDLQIDAELKNEENNTALIAAAKTGSLDVMKVIVNSCKNVNVNATGKEHKTALHYAVLRNSDRMVQVLCNASIDTEIKNHGGRTALLAAAYNTKLEVLKVILNSCANVSLNAKGNKGKTALHYAAEKCNFEMAKLLVDKDASRFIEDNTGNTPYKLIPSPSVDCHKNTTAELQTLLSTESNKTVGQAT